MKKLVVLVILGSILGSLRLDAQVVSGLKGDRLFVNLASQFSMLPKDGLGPISFHGEGEYIYKNYRSVALRAGYSSFPSGFNWLNSEFNSDDYLIQNALGDFVTTTFSGSLVFKNYRRKRGDLAPLGQYWLHGLKINSSQIDLTYMIIDGRKGASYDGGIFNFTSVVPLVGFGKNSLIAPKLLLNWEINSELDLGSFARDRSAGRNGDYESYFVGTAKENNFYWNLFQLKLGLTYALF